MPEKGARKQRLRPAVADEQTVDAALFERLKRTRRKLADERKVPAYVIFSDATLLEMVNLRPQTLTEMMHISGIGPMKLERYARHFLQEIRR